MGQPVHRERGLELIQRCHDLVADPACTVDEATWQDLAMAELFAKVDRTRSLPGRQVLYHQMRTYVRDDGVLAERARPYRLFRWEAALREALQSALRTLESRRAGWRGPCWCRPSRRIPARPGAGTSSAPCPWGVWSG